MMKQEVARIAARVEAGARLSFADGLALYREADLTELGLLAGATVRRRFAEGTVTYAVDRLVVYAAGCADDCPFCTPATAPLRLDAAAVVAKAQQLQAAGGTGLWLQGSHAPDLQADDLLGLCRRLKEACPDLDLCAFSPSEIWAAAQHSGISVQDLVRALSQVGVDLLPGGAHESLRARQREGVQQVAEPWDLFDAVVRAAAAVGLPMTAHFVYGGTETVADRLNALLRLRNVQEETGGVFRAVLPWGLPVDNTLGVPGVSSHEYLRWVALARLMLDNVAHLTASWLTQGARVAQVALDGGASDLGGTLMQDDPLTVAGVRFGLDSAQMQRIITDAGRVPVLRGSAY